jgi:hypothetical protein
MNAVKNQMRLSKSELKFFFEWNRFKWHLKRHQTSLSYLG